MRRIYLDHAATTPILPEVHRAMQPWLGEEYGNPSAVHAWGRDAKRAVERARKQVAQALHAAHPQEIYFTGGGTEGDNWAIKGAAFAHMERGRHIITTAIEHHAVLHSCQWLEKLGWEVTYLHVDSAGIVNPEDVARAIRPDTVLVSVMMANNEVGTLQPIAEIGRICREKKVLFHTDAVQAIGAIPVDVQVLNVDLLTLSAHKLGGPKGVGALYIRKGVKIDSLLHGGAQERGLRAGTENVAGIVGLGRAIELATAHLPEKAARMIQLRDMLIESAMALIPGTNLNGHPTERLPGNVNLSFDGVESEALLLRLDLAGVAGSAGSACTAGALDPTHVLKALGLTDAQARGALRLTLGTDTTEDDVNEAVQRMVAIIADLRKSC